MKELILVEVCQQARGRQEQVHAVQEEEPSADSTVARVYMDTEGSCSAKTRK